MKNQEDHNLKGKNKNGGNIDNYRATFIFRSSGMEIYDV